MAVVRHRSRFEVWVAARGLGRGGGWRRRWRRTRRPQGRVALLAPQTYL